MLFSIVTPTRNSERFLEACIHSVIGQNHSALEYIIIDGASTDKTLDIVRRHEKHISFWTSEPDNGMYEAIQKGFAHSQGEIMAWLNSDDMYLPWTLQVVDQIFSELPQVDWITSIRPLLWNEQGLATECMALPGFSRKGFWRGEHMPGSRGFVIESVQQESTFWRRTLWERAGGKMDTTLRLAGDFELWARFYQLSDLIGVRVPLSGFRTHTGQLTAAHLAEYHREARDVLRRYGGSEQGSLRSLLRRHVSPFIPRRFRPKLAGVGLYRRSPICVYDQSTRRWKIRYDYI
jgi:glycosyltransferase involved in cell wall biosynthesis